MPCSIYLKELQWETDCIMPNKQKILLLCYTCIRLLQTHMGLDGAEDVLVHYCELMRLSSKVTNQRDPVPSYWTSSSINCSWILFCLVSFFFFFFQLASEHTTFLCKTRFKGHFPSSTLEWDQWTSLFLPLDFRIYNSGGKNTSHPIFYHTSVRYRSTSRWEVIFLYITAF